MHFVAMMYLLLLCLFSGVHAQGTPKIALEPAVWQPKWYLDRVILDDKTNTTRTDRLVLTFFPYRMIRAQNKYDRMFFDWKDSIYHRILKALEDKKYLVDTDDLHPEKKKYPKQFDGTYYIEPGYFSQRSLRFHFYLKKSKEASLKERFKEELKNSFFSSLFFPSKQDDKSKEIEEKEIAHYPKAFQNEIKKRNSFLSFLKETIFTERNTLYDSEVLNYESHINYGSLFNPYSVFWKKGKIFRFIGFQYGKEKEKDEGKVDGLPLGGQRIGNFLIRANIRRPLISKEFQAFQ
jgi:6-pyruvoyl-tetrahydropterin synthase